MTGSSAVAGDRPLPTGPEGLVCSAKDCRAAGRVRPAVEQPEDPHRRTGASTGWPVAEHRESLTSFLSARGFLRDVEDLPEPSE